MNRPTLRLVSALSLALGGSVPRAPAQRSYDPGATDSEIRIGQVTTSAEWARAYRAVGLAEAAYFQMVNDRGGTRGRQIRLVSVDSGPGSAQPADLARQLVEREQVLLIFSSIGTETNLAMRGYLNERKVPQLFVESSSAVFDDPAHYPWTMGFFATYRAEAAAYARYILGHAPGGRIAVLYANDDAGREYLAGVREGLGDRASAMIARAVSYPTGATTLEAPVRELRDSGADVFLNLSVGAPVTEAIRRAYDLGWHPLQFIPNASLSVAAFLDPAGLQKAEGIIANARSKGWMGSQARSDPAVQEFLAWMSRYNPQASLRDQNNVAGYERAQALVEVLGKCGDDLTRANVMRQASSLDLELGMLRPGIRIRTSPGDYQPIKQLYLIRFNGRSWAPLGPTTGG